jgi:hypothetical protein
MKTVRADLHNHLQTSDDMSKLDFNQVIDIASQRLGEDGILGVVNMKDHRFEDFVQLRGYDREHLGDGEFYVPEKKLYLLKGQEIVTRGGGGHLLGIGLPLKHHIPDQLSVEQTLKEIISRGGFSCVDHPYGKDGLGDYLIKREELMSCYVDFWESHNGESGLWIPGLLPRGANQKAQRVYDNEIRGTYQIGEIFSSDGHSLKEIGTSYVELNMPEIGDVENDIHSQISLALKNLQTRRTKGKKSNSRFMGAVHLANLVLTLGPKQFIINRLTKS